ncbi:cysteine synthase domain protein [Mycobacterium xenopi 3993]|nr:cysteine synthase domain protein [Mycobacterium xenopi 3993]
MAAKALAAKERADIAFVVADAGGSTCPPVPTPVALTRLSKRWKGSYGRKTRRRRGCSRWRP